MIRSGNAVSKGSDKHRAAGRCIHGLFAVLALALLAPALNPSKALAVGGEQSLDSPATMGYTTMKVVGHIKEDLTEFTFWNWEIREDPSEFDPNGPCCELYNAGDTVHTVENEFGGLKPNTTYYARIKVSRFGEGITFSNVVSGTTLAVGSPTVLDVDDAASASFTSAHVSGEVEGVVGPDPAFESSCRFEYVSDAEYGARSESQELSVRATGGTFVLSYGGSSTEPLAYDASASSVGSALEALPPIGAGNVAVSGGPGDPFGDTPYTIFFQGSLAGTDVEQASVDSTGLAPSGSAGADVQATVNGHGVEEFNRAGSVACDPDPITTAGATGVEADLTGLESGTTYHLRLAISNLGGGDSETASDFTTLAVAPPPRSRWTMPKTPNSPRPTSAARSGVPPAPTRPSTSTVDSSTSPPNSSSRAASRALPRRRAGRTRSQGSV